MPPGYWQEPTPRRHSFFAVGNAVFQLGISNSNEFSNESSYLYLSQQFILNRDFHATGRCKSPLPTSPISSIKGKWFYFVCFLGLFNNEIVEWQLSQSFDCLFVCQAAKRLLEKTTCTGRPVLLHSDQGAQYISSGYPTQTVRCYPMHVKGWHIGHKAAQHESPAKCGRTFHKAQLNTLPQALALP